jgi:hypothetical protein
VCDVWLQEASVRFKKSRFGPRLVAAARDGSLYRDVHVFIGGTGAVGGSAVLQMISMLEEMMSVRAPDGPDDVPVLIVTGRNDEDIEAFIARLKRFTRARWGGDTSPRRFEHGYLTPGGVYVSLSSFQLKPIRGLDAVTEAESAERDAAVDAFLAVADTSRSLPRRDIADALMRHVRSVRPLSEFFEDRIVRLRDYGPKPFKSLLIGVPLPSILSYQTGGLTDVAAATGLGDDLAQELKREFERVFGDDLVAVRERWGIRVLVAHTTGVGGMYDELSDGATNPRLGFAHAAIDNILRQKHIEAERITTEYSGRGLYVLVTAAAIGIDEVKVRERIPLNRAVVDELRRAPRELFHGMRARREVREPDGTKRFIAVRQFLRVLRPVMVPAAIDAPQGESRPLFLKVVEDIRPEFVIRSGENGFFSAANADALYRVMKVATASELGHVLASVALLGDDPHVPWFAPPSASVETRSGGICYYTETANSKQVFDFLYQPALLSTQLSGLEPLSLQDLGSAKHQAELHTLGLLILLHRLRASDFDQLPTYPQASFDPRKFFVETSRPLTFRDIESWDLSALAADLRTLVLARSRGHLLPLKPLRDPGQFGGRDEAHMSVLDVVLRAVWAIPSLGSPIVVEDGDRLVARVGYYIAPFGRVLTDQDGLRRLFASGYETAAPRCTAAEYQAFQMSVNGFIDLRPVGVTCTARTTAELGSASVAIARDDRLFTEHIRQIEPYSFFATCGLVAVIHRLRSIGAFFRTARPDLGTMQDAAWSMPRDEHGHLYVVPGVVEAFRMMSEGQEKATGTEWLDGFWGYDRRLPENRIETVMRAVQKSQSVHSSDRLTKPSPE